MIAASAGFFDDWLGARKRAEAGEAERGEWILAPGARIGAWRVGGPLGRGGSCEVYHAESAEFGSPVGGAGERSEPEGVSHAESAENAEPSLVTRHPSLVTAAAMPRRAALKILHRTDATAAERFRREVEILRGTDHPALPRLLDAGETPDGRPWMAVEELEKRELPRRDRDVARFVLALCGGLAHLHARGVVHRDVKPSNVLFRADGSPVLIDLGLVKRWTAPEGSEAAGPSAAPAFASTAAFPAPSRAAPTPSAIFTSVSEPIPSTSAVSVPVTVSISSILSPPNFCSPAPNPHPLIPNPFSFFPYPFFTLACPLALGPSCGAFTTWLPAWEIFPT